MITGIGGRLGEWIRRADQGRPLAEQASWRSAGERAAWLHRQPDGSADHTLAALLDRVGACRMSL